MDMDEAQIKGNVGTKSKTNNGFLALIIVSSLKDSINLSLLPPSSHKESFNTSTLVNCK